MQQQRSSYLGLILILGLLSMLMPLAIDMYLPSLPTVAEDFGVDNGQVQMTLSSYILGFAIGQMVYGPMADSLGRKPVILGGVTVFALTSAACAMVQNIDDFIYMRFLHGFSAAAAGVVINALMRDLFTKDEFSRSMSFVILVMTIAPLIAPILGGMIMIWFTWHAIFWSIAVTSVIAVFLIAFFIRETLPKEKRQKFHLRTTVSQFIMLFRQRRVFCYMLASGFSFAGMFSFLSAGPFVYIELNGVSPQHFGYYFALNIVFLFVMTTINSRYVRRFGALKMMYFGLSVQFVMGIWLLLSTTLDFGFTALVIGVAAYICGISMITSNVMAVVLDDYPHMAGTVSSLAGTIRFGISALVGVLLAMLPARNAWPMVGSMVLSVILAVLLIVYAKKRR
ncbi:bicyclomycin/multidrug efflux system [Photorhabdus luminescens subsp. luminescens]|uniref:Bcr/CflA family efflux transporter n=2 Tax=Photorhabdus luminescens TaxID=29488 RepID=A0A1G5REY0_PHOLU|nr:Bcr/CflA family multidrug efflux MFS transporter [Photorhabdus luminescens]MCW7761130.1 Bcr/CflA family multidrug efflux MFS transporter [Photorhabdus luminescens subsp. venezuelensis]KMW71881.1 bicyclomycin/multidrug efflux system [Photorhabdus luminescens subsp. luminescens]OWO79393.1 Bcr/CflA family multidrug efflux MFS transporter [Photorhabdus luminescens]TDB56185.1 Bcr/CflA family drug resistance efflux transporter [Photorhabdus luminescens subsp. mexicana]SCZ71839.1 MFS transporter, 